MPLGTSGRFLVVEDRANRRSDGETTKQCPLSTAVVLCTILSTLVLHSSNDGSEDTGTVGWRRSCSQ